MMPRVFVVMPVYNRRAITERFADCLRRQSWGNYHLVLVDDGSTDGTAESLKSRINALTVVRGRGDWWWAGSLQRGLEAVESMLPAPEDILLLTNDDLEIEDNFLESAVAALQTRPRTLLLARARDAATGQILETGVEADFRALSFRIATDAARINCLPTRGLFLRWSDAQTIGGFHPRLLPHYLSDYEWTIRAHRRGLRCVTVPELYFVQQPTGVSGAVDFDASGPVDVLRRGLSKKSRVNPFSWIVFILLAADRRSMPFALIKLFQRIGRELLRQAGRALGRA